MLRDSTLGYLLGTACVILAAIIAGLLVLDRRPRRGQAADPVDVHAEQACALTAPTMQIPLGVGVPGTDDGPSVNVICGPRKEYGYLGRHGRRHFAVEVTADGTCWVVRDVPAPSRRARKTRDGGAR